MKLNKKYQYVMGLCGVCEKPVLAREETQAEINAKIKRLKGKSISKFEHISLVFIKSFCNDTSTFLACIPYSYEQAQAFIKRKNYFDV